MTRAHRLTIRLKKKQTEKLRQLVRSGRAPARVQTRGRILLMLGKNMPPKEISAALDVAYSRVRRIAKTFKERGYIKAVFGESPPGRPRKIKDKERQQVIATACSEAPAGRERWTVRLLVEQLGKSGIKVSREWVRQVLKGDELKPWREKNVVRSQAYGRVSGTNGGRAQSL